MMSDGVRKFLAGAAWLLIVLGPVLTGLTLVDILTTPGGFLDGDLRGGVSIVVGLVSPIVTGGVLLVLLSIDKRLEAKA